MIRTMCLAQLELILQEEEPDDDHNEDVKRRSSIFLYCSRAFHNDEDLYDKGLYGREDGQLVNTKQDKVDNKEPCRQDCGNVEEDESDIVRNLSDMRLCNKTHQMDSKLPTTLNKDISSPGFEGEVTPCDTEAEMMKSMGLPLSFVNGCMEDQEISVSRTSKKTSRTRKNRDYRRRRKTEKRWQSEGKQERSSSNIKSWEDYWSVFGEELIWNDWVTKYPQFGETLTSDCTQKNDFDSNQNGENVFPNVQGSTDNPNEGLVLDRCLNCGKVKQEKNLKFKDILLSEAIPCEEVLSDFPSPCLCLDTDLTSELYVFKANGGTCFGNINNHNDTVVSENTLIQEKNDNENKSHISEEETKLEVTLNAVEDNTKDGEVSKIMPDSIDSNHQCQAEESKVMEDQTVVGEGTNGNGIWTEEWISLWEEHSNDTYWYYYAWYNEWRSIQDNPSEVNNLDPSNSNDLSCDIDYDRDDEINSNGSGDYMTSEPDECDADYCGDDGYGNLWEDGLNVVEGRKGDNENDEDEDANDDDDEEEDSLSNDDDDERQDGTKKKKVPTATLR